MFHCSFDIGFCFIGNGFDSNYGHRVMTSGDHVDAETDVSAEDEEVNRITSTPSSSDGPLSTPSLISANPRRVSDSGIQQVSPRPVLDFLPCFCCFAGEVTNDSAVLKLDV